MINLNWILLALSGVVLLSYIFDLVGHLSRIPSVVMLLLLGLVLRFAFDLAGPNNRFIELLLPLLGTLGLVLIVLDGALELRLTKHARVAVIRAAVAAALGIASTGAVFATWLHFFANADWLSAWVVATPFAIISSAVAIPAAISLLPVQREHVVYESALSDIFGVLLFYALLDAQQGWSTALMNVAYGVSASGLIGGVLGVLMASVIGRIQSHVRFVPMIFGLIGAYAGSKLLHLAPLVTVLSVGLILNNLDQIQHLKVLRKIVPLNLTQDVAAFKSLTAEITFVVRTFFFVLLGYSTKFSDLMTPIAWGMAALLLVLIFTLRSAVLRVVMGTKTGPLLWLAPRGLITVLLYINIPQSLLIPQIPNGLLMLTVLGSVVVMMLGLLWCQTQPKVEQESVAS